MKTVAFDVSYIQRRRAGYGRFSFELLRGLLARDSKREYLLHGWSLSLDEEMIRALSGPNVRFALARIPGPVKRFYWNTLRLPHLEAFIGKFDLFHCSEPLLPPVGRALSVITLHDLSYRKFPEFFTRTVAGWDVHILHALRRADAVIVPSENTRQDLGEMFNVPREKVHIVHPPVDPAFFQSITEDSIDRMRRKFNLPREYFLFVGTIEPRKNIPTLVEAYEQFRRATRADIPLVLVGKPGWLYKEIFRTIDRSAERPNIRVLDYVDEHDLAALYRAATLFLYPSLYEGFGLPVVEAMASGVPVITADNSSLHEIARDAAVLIDPAHSEHLADAMLSLYRDEPARQNLIQLGLRRAEQFSIAAAADAVLDLYTAMESR